MKLEHFLSSIAETCNEYKVLPREVWEMIDFQDFKSAYRGKEADLEHSFEVVKRYLKIHKKAYTAEDIKKNGK